MPVILPGLFGASRIGSILPHIGKEGLKGASKGITSTETLKEKVLQYAIQEAKNEFGVSAAEHVFKEIIGKSEKGVDFYKTAVRPRNFREDLEADHQVRLDCVNAQTNAVSSNFYIVNGRDLSSFVKEPLEFVNDYENIGSSGEENKGFHIEVDVLS